MGSESGGSAVDSVAGEHSGNVAGVPSSLLGQRVGRKLESCIGPGIGFSRGKFWELIKSLEIQ